MLKHWILRIVLGWVANGLESRWPGIAPLIRAIVAFLEGGGNAASLHDHCNQLPEFTVTDLKKDYHGFL